MKAVIYARYSSNKQTEQSIEGQLRVCKEYAEKKGYEVVAEYIDRAMTGTNSNRPEFLRMIADAENKHFDAIIVYKLDRFSRNRYDSVVYKHRLKQKGIKVDSAMESISDSMEGKLVEGLLEMMAEMYSQDLSQKVKRGMNESFLKGNFTGGTISYGYKVLDKKIFIDEEKAKIVKYIFEEYAKGTTKQEIVKQLNDKGHKTGKGAKFSYNSIQTMLKNKKYIGINEQVGNVNKNMYSPIIELALFNKVQERLGLNKRFFKKKANINYYLSGKAFCGYCGASLIGMSGRSHTDKKHYYYACSNKRNKKLDCAKMTEQKAELEWTVVKRVIDVLNDKNRLEHIADQIIEGFSKDTTAIKIKEYEKQIIKIEKELDKVFDMFYKAENNNALIERLKQKSSDLELQRKDIEEEIRKLKLLKSTATVNRDELVELLKLITVESIESEEDLKKFVDCYVNSVFVFNNMFVVYFNTTDYSPIVTYEEMTYNMREEKEEPENQIIVPKKSNSKHKKTGQTKIVRPVNGVVALRGIEPLNPP